MVFVLAVDVPDTKPKLVHKEHRTVNINTSAVVDNDLNTCINLHTLERNVLKLPTGQYAEWDITVKATYSLPDSQCTSYNDILFMVHDSPPLHMDSQGTFKICDLIDQSIDVTNHVAILTYNCICQYGPCENVVIRSNSPIDCGWLCDINIETT